MRGDRRVHGINPAFVSHSADGTEWVWNFRFNKRLDQPRREATMLAKTKSWPALISRRSLLQRAAAAAGAATILGGPPHATIAAPKTSKKAVAYQDHPDGDKRCDKCMQFQPPDACKMVEGPISPEGSCRIFAPVRQS